MKSSLTKILPKVLGTAIIIVIIAYLSKKLYLSWSEIPFETISFNYKFLILSFVGLFFSFLCALTSWQIILFSLGAKIGFKKSWWVITGSYLAKYIPGHVWSIGGRMYLCKKEGISEKISGAGMLLEMISLLLAALLASLLYIPSIISKGFSSWMLVLLSFIPISLIMLFTPLLNIILKLTARYVFKKEISLEIKKSWLGLNLLIYVINVVVQGVAFFLLILSIFPLPVGNLPAVIGLYNGAWAAGFLSFITPGGLGVREGAVALLLKSYMPFPMAIIIAGISRLWVMIFEIIIAGIGFIIRK